jgi:hypothetical protein
MNMALGPTPVTVNQNNFGRESGHQQCVSSRGANESSANDCDPRNAGSNSIMLLRRAITRNIKSGKHWSTSLSS